MMGKNKMVKRTSLEIQQKIIAYDKTGKFTHLQIGQKYGMCMGYRK